MTLEVGDVITTGTPAGVGQLRAGDSVDVDITGNRTLSKQLISEQDEKLSATNCLKHTCEVACPYRRITRHEYVESKCLHVDADMYPVSRKPDADSS